MHVAVLTLVCAVGLVLVHILVLGILLVIEQRSVRAVETLWRGVRRRWMDAGSALTNVGFRASPTSAGCIGVAS